MVAFKACIYIGALMVASASLQAQPSGALHGLAADITDVRSPRERVTGTPGNMRITDRSCTAMPLEDMRRRIVHTAVQEWAFFGFSIDDQASAISAQQRSQPSGAQMLRGAFGRMSAAENARLASSIAGYWAATPDSDWILQRQNDNWKSEGDGARWRHAWSAAFISWVMCESGLAEPEQFRRAIAHHTYIDQAIRATDGRDSRAVFTAYDPGQAVVEPGDLLCRGSRPVYQNVAQRRAQLGEGARTHCDIVVQVDAASRKITVIGGNVRGTVRMKVLQAVEEEGQALRASSDNGRLLFAHLKLEAPSLTLSQADFAPHLKSVAAAGSL